MLVKVSHPKNLLFSFLLLLLCFTSLNIRSGIFSFGITASRYENVKSFVLELAEDGNTRRVEFRYHIEGMARVFYDRQHLSLDEAKIILEDKLFSGKIIFVISNTEGCSNINHGPTTTITRCRSARVKLFNNRNGWNKIQTFVAGIELTKNHNDGVATILLTNPRDPETPDINLEQLPTFFELEKSQ